MPFVKGQEVDDERRGWLEKWHDVLPAGVSLSSSDLRKNKNGSCRSES